jgi:hypothetical protein
MMVRALPPWIVRTPRNILLRCWPNVCSDRSDGKFGFRLAYARAGAADDFSRRTCQRGQAMDWNGVESPLGVGGLIAWKEAFQLPHLISCADFFLALEILIFSKEIKFFKAAEPNCFDKSKQIERTGAGRRPFIFSACFHRRAPKICREIT